MTGTQGANELEDLGELVVLEGGDFAVERCDEVLAWCVGEGCRGVPARWSPAGGCGGEVVERVRLPAQRPTQRPQCQRPVGVLLGAFEFADGGDRNAGLGGEVVLGPAEFEPSGSDLVGRDRVRRTGIVAGSLLGHGSMMAETLPMWK